MLPGKTPRTPTVPNFLQKPMPDSHRIDWINQRDSVVDRLKTIVLVDACPVSLVEGKAVLANSYNILTASSGKNLLEILEVHVPNLILLNVNLPCMSGIETLKILKRAPLKTSFYPFACFLSSKKT